MKYFDIYVDLPSNCDAKSHFFLIFSIVNRNSRHRGTAEKGVRNKDG